MFLFTLARYNRVNGIDQQPGLTSSSDLFIGICSVSEAGLPQWSLFECLPEQRLKGKLCGTVFTLYGKLSYENDF